MRKNHSPTPVHLIFFSAVCFTFALAPDLHAANRPTSFGQKFDPIHTRPFPAKGTATLDPKTQAVLQDQTIRKKAEAPKQPLLTRPELPINSDKNR